jgi:membrane-associated protein
MTLNLNPFEVTMTPETILQTLGYSGFAAIIFAESGLFFGFFLPGDSLLFAAGVLAAAGYFNIWLIVVLAVLAAVFGDSTGYYIGGHFGKWLLKKEENWWWKKSHLIAAENFYEKRGAITLVLARFMPFIRSFVPLAAGISKMNYRKFLQFNLIGGIAWGVSLPVLGYFLGQLIPDIEKYIVAIVLGIVVVSLIGPALHLLNSRMKKEGV